MFLDEASLDIVWKLKNGILAMLPVAKQTKKAMDWLKT